MTEEKRLFPEKRFFLIAKSPKGGLPSRWCSPWQFFFFLKFQVRRLFSVSELPTQRGVGAWQPDQQQLPRCLSLRRRGDGWAELLSSFSRSPSHFFLFVFLPWVSNGLYIFSFLFSPLLVHTALSVLTTDRGYGDLILTVLMERVGLVFFLFFFFSILIQDLKPEFLFRCCQKHFIREGFSMLYSPLKRSSFSKLSHECRPGP